MPGATDGASTVREGRSAFFYQTQDAVDAIRTTFSGSKLSTALAIYMSFTEAANRQGGAAARNGFTGGRKELAAMSGVSPDTLDRYVKIFEEIGLLEVERRKVGTANLPNEWRLVDAPSSRSRAATLAAPVRHNAGAIPVGEEVEAKKEDPPVGPPAKTVDLNRPATVDRKPVTDAEYHTATEILYAFNRRAGSNYSSADWIKKIIGRLREHPELTLPAHCVVIDRVLLEPWWSGDPSPSVIYGNASIFERSVHAVRSEPADRPLTGDDVRARYGADSG